jgi:hypothetical protein
MARLVCMYGGTYPARSCLDPRTEAALNKYAAEVGLGVEWVDTTDNFQTYADEMEKRWHGEEDLIIVEQDKEVHSLCLPSFLTCSGLWCAYTYWINPEPHTTLVLGGFGVTKFSAEIQRLVPVSAFRGETQVSIDRRFNDYLMESHGIGCCLHGNVVHHHTYEPRPLKIRAYVNGLREQGILPPAMNPPALDPGLLPGSYRLGG